MKTYLQTIYQEIISKKDWETKYKEVSPVDPEEYQKVAPILKRLFTKLNGGTFSPVIVVDYTGIVKKINVVDKELMRILRAAGYDINASLYKLGLALKNGKEVAIKTIIDSLKSKNIDIMKDQYEKTKNENIKKQIDLVSAFKEKISSIQSSLTLPTEVGKYKIVFSMNFRHIASQSTEVGWTSCMNLNTGMYKSYVGPGISKGAFIAFITKVGDEEKLDSPTARVLFKPFVGRSTKNIVWQADKIYGDAPSDFREFAQSIIDKHQKKYSDTYVIGGDKEERSFYLDLLPSAMKINSLKMQKLLNQIRELLVNNEDDKRLAMLEKLSPTHQIFIIENIPSRIRGRLLDSSYINNLHSDTIDFLIDEGYVRFNDLWRLSGEKMTKDQITNYLSTDPQNNFEEVFEINQALIDKKMILSILNNFGGFDFLPYIDQYKIKFADIFPMLQNPVVRIDNFISYEMLQKWSKQISALPQSQFNSLQSIIGDFLEQILEDELFPIDKIFALLKENTDMIGHLNKKTQLSNYFSEKQIIELIKINTVVYLYLSDKENAKEVFINALFERDYFDEIVSVARYASQMGTQLPRVFLDKTREKFFSKNHDKVSASDFRQYQIIFKMIYSHQINTNDYIDLFDIMSRVKDIDNFSGLLNERTLINIASAISNSKDDKLLFKLATIYPSVFNDEAAIMQKATQKILQPDVFKKLYEIDAEKAIYVISEIITVKKRHSHPQYGEVRDDNINKIMNYLKEKIQSSGLKMFDKYSDMHMDYEMTRYVDTFFQQIMKNMNDDEKTKFYDELLRDDTTLKIANKIYLPVNFNFVSKEIQHKILLNPEKYWRLTHSLFESDNVDNDFIKKEILRKKDFAFKTELFRYADEAYVYSLIKKKEEEILMQLIAHRVSSSGDTIRVAARYNFTKERFIELMNMMNELIQKETWRYAETLVPYIEAMTKGKLSDVSIGPNIKYQNQTFAEKEFKHVDFKKIIYFNDRDILKSIPNPKKLIKVLSTDTMRNFWRELLKYHKIIV